MKIVPLLLTGQLRRRGGRGSAPSATARAGHRHRAGLRRRCRPTAAPPSRCRHGRGSATSGRANGVAIAGATGSSYADRRPPAGFDPGRPLCRGGEYAGGSILSDATLTLAGQRRPAHVRRQWRCARGRRPRAATEPEPPAPVQRQREPPVQRPLRAAWSLSPLTAGPQASQQSQPVNLTARLALPGPPAHAGAEGQALGWCPATEGVSRIQLCRQRRGGGVAGRRPRHHRHHSTTRREYTLVALTGWCRPRRPNWRTGTTRSSRTSAVLVCRRQLGRRGGVPALPCHAAAIATGAGLRCSHHGQRAVALPPAARVGPRRWPPASAADDGVTWRQADGRTSPWAA